MDTLLNDEFINKRIVSRLLKEVKDEEIQRTINEISYFNEIRKSEILKNATNPSKTDFIKKLEYARENIVL